jgi:hypothetical protein
MFITYSDTSQQFNPSYPATESPKIGASSTIRECLGLPQPFIFAKNGPNASCYSKCTQI